MSFLEAGATYAFLLCKWNQLSSEHLMDQAESTHAQLHQQGGGQMGAP
jgi:hypothetical protein